ncbi:MAG: gp58-like family protein [Chromatiales bacterium]|nr:gp58-like family protein [Chromatiales bacterium]
MPKKTTVKEMEQAASENNVDKIRDILFGGQMKDYEGRFKRLEEKLTQEASRLTQDMEDRMNSLEKFMRKEIDLKAEQLQQERKDRLDGLKNLDQALQSLNATLNDRLNELDEGNRRSLSDTRQEFHDEISILQTRLREQQENLTRSLEEEATQLRNDKVSRSNLSGLLSEMSMRLSGEFNVPGDEA